jgi:hypothetical protein
MIGRDQAAFLSRGKVAIQCPNTTTSKAEARRKSG